MNYKFLGVDVFGIEKKARLTPSIFQCWFLHLKYLSDSVRQWSNSLPESDEKILLDVGSGEDSPYHSLFNSKVKKIITLDPFTKNVDINCPVEQILLADESVDYILSTQVLEHVRNPFAASHEIRRVLKNSGIAFISTHGIWEIHRLPKDYWRFTPDSFYELFDNFKEVKIIANGGAILCIGQLLNITLSHLSKTMLRAPIIFMWSVINILTIFFDRLFKINNRLVINYVVILKK